MLGLVGVGVAGVAVGCSSSATPDAEGAGAPKSSSQDEAGYPVTVKHKFGRTTIEKAPERVIALGQTDCDPIIALGVTPIAVGTYLSKTYTPVHPWNSAGFGDGAPHEVSFMEIDAEKIAALQPDLITCVSGGLDQKNFELLSKICPVIGTPTGYQDYAVPYGPHTKLIGQALARTTAAAKLVDDLDQQYADIRQKHPGWSDKLAVCAEAFDGGYDVLGETAPRTGFLTGIGLKLSPELTKLVGKDYNKAISAERLDLIADLDLVVWCTDKDTLAALKKDRLVTRMPSTRGGHVIWTTGDKSDELLWAMDWGTVLSSRYAIEHGVPLVEAAIAGENPAGQDG